MPTKLIRVHMDTLEKLVKLGNAGQSYNSVIEKLLEKRGHEDTV